MAEATPIRPISADHIADWAYEADVVVAGFGVAGASAAVGAAQNGADVLVLERTGGWGGAAAMAGGFIYMGGGTPLQKACGFEDTVDSMKAFMKAALGRAPTRPRSTRTARAASTTTTGWSTSAASRSS